MNKKFTSLPTVYPEELSAKGMAIYEKISKKMEKKNFGKYLAIEVESGKYFIGNTLIEAMENAKKNFLVNYFILSALVFLVYLLFLTNICLLLMKTFFDKKNHPKIKLTVKGRKQSGRLEAVLDTGFDGFLSLPITIAVALGLELTGLVPVEYADGRTSKELVFAVEVDLDGSLKTVPTTLTAGSEALAGTALFNDYELKFNFPKQKITFEKLS